MHYSKIGIKNGYAPLGLYISSYMDTIDYGPTAVVRYYIVYDSYMI